MFVSSNFMQSNIPQQNKTQKYPNFKALVMEPNIKQNVKQVYHPMIDKLGSLKDKLADYKFWDLAVTSSGSNPHLYLQSKKNGIIFNAYPAYYDDIESRLGKAFVPIVMYSKNQAYSQEKVVSPYDTVSDFNRHIVHIIYDNKVEAKEALKTMRTLDSEFLNMYGDKPILNGDVLKLPLYMLEALEKSSAKKPEVDIKYAEAVRVQEQAKREAKLAEEKRRKEQAELAAKLAEQRRQQEQSGTASFQCKTAAKAVQGTTQTNASGKKKGFAKVAGMNELKETLREDVILPLQNVELYKKYGINPANGILLYGPPGTGKTFIAEALAEESGRKFIRMNVSDVESKWVGETSKNIAKIFKEAETKAPSVIFIDEFEALAPSRGTLNGDSSAAIGHNQSVNTLLQNMNNCGEKGVFVIAATNEPQKVDSAVRRAGRIDRNIFVPPPDLEARKELFRMALEDIYSDKNINYDNLAALTENYTAPEINQIIVRQAALNALKQNRMISESDLVEQIKRYKPQLNSNLVAAYKSKGATSKKSTNVFLPKVGFNVNNETKK